MYVYISVQADRYTFPFLMLFGMAFSFCCFSLSRSSASLCWSFNTKLLRALSANSFLVLFKFCCSRLFAAACWSLFWASCLTSLARFSCSKTNFCRLNVYIGRVIQRVIRAVRGTIGGLQHTLSLTHTQHTHRAR